MARNNKKQRKRMNDTNREHRIDNVTKKSFKEPQESKKRLSQQLSPKEVKNKGLEYANRKRKQSSVASKKKIWFDGVDECLIRSSMSDTNYSESQTTSKLVKDKSFSGLTQIVAMDCEMVGTGYDGTTSVLARVSIVNFFGHCIYDKFVKPIEEVTDYRTAVSGVRPSDLVNATDLRTVQQEVHQILKDRIVVGHALSNDFKALFLSHPKHKTRDTSIYFRKLLGGPKPSLKKLAQTLLGVTVQGGEHDSVEDARAAMRLFTMYRKKWDSDLKKNKLKFKANKRKK